MTRMRRETIAIHGGFRSDPATRAVAVPIYQTAAYAFDSAEHGAALFNLAHLIHRVMTMGLRSGIATLQQRDPLCWFDRVSVHIWQA